MWKPFSVKSLAESIQTASIGHLGSLLSVKHDFPEDRLTRTVLFFTVIFMIERVELNAGIPIVARLLDLPDLAVVLISI